MNTTILKAKKVCERRGVLGMIRRGFAEAVNWANALRVIPRTGAIDEPREAVEFAWHTCGGFIRPFQVKSEIVHLMELVRSNRPQVVVEIGTANGGTLFLLTRMAAEDAWLFSIDLPGGECGAGYAVWRLPVYNSFPLARQSLSLLRGDSHSPQMRERLTKALGGRKIDVLFIDGDHTYSGVRDDFMSYSPLVRLGGMIAFHDIAKHTRTRTCEVDVFWDEVRQGFEHTEFVEDRDQGWAGIGVLKVNHR